MKIGDLLLMDLGKAVPASVKLKGLKAVDFLLKAAVFLACSAMLFPASLLILSIPPVERFFLGILMGDGSIGVCIVATLVLFYHALFAYLVFMGARYCWRILRFLSFLALAALFCFELHLALFGGMPFEETRLIFLGWSEFAFVFGSLALADLAFGRKLNISSRWERRIGNSGQDSP